MNYKPRAIAGTARVVGEGAILVQERVVYHYSKTHTTSTPEFCELVGLTVEETVPGAISNGTAYVTYHTEAE